MTTTTDTTSDRRMRLPRQLARLLATTFWTVRVHGEDHLPRTGPVVLAVNHLALLDGPLVFAVSGRAVHFLAKKELFLGPLGLLLRWVGQIPVDRQRADRRALTTCLGVLADGGVVGVFPEGTRGDGDFATIHHGVAYLALKSGALIVPVACLGTRSSGGDRSSIAGFRARVDVVFGVPFSLTAASGSGGRRAVAGAAAEIQARLRAHLQEAAAVRPAPDVKEAS